MGLRALQVKAFCGHLGKLLDFASQLLQAWDMKLGGCLQKWDVLELKELDAVSAEASTLKQLGLEEMHFYTCASEYQAYVKFLSAFLARVDLVAIVVKLFHLCPSTDEAPEEDSDADARVVRKISVVRELVAVRDCVLTPLAPDLIDSLRSLQESLGLDDAAQKKYQEELKSWRQLGPAVMDFLHARVVDLSDEHQALLSNSAVDELVRLAEWSPSPKLDRECLQCCAAVVKVAVAGPTLTSEKKAEARPTRVAPDTVPVKSCVRARAHHATVCMYDV